MDSRNTLPPEMIRMIISYLDVNDLKMLRLTSTKIEKYISAYWSEKIRVRITCRNYQETALFLSRHESVDKVKVLVPSYRKIEDSKFKMQNLMNSIPETVKDIEIADDERLEREINAKVKRFQGLSIKWQQPVFCLKTDS